MKRKGIGYLILGIIGGLCFFLDLYLTIRDGFAKDKVVFWQVCRLFLFAFYSGLFMRRYFVKERA